jgi:hypothetical protein
MSGTRKCHEHIVWGQAGVVRLVTGKKLDLTVVADAFASKHRENLGANVINTAAAAGRPDWANFRLLGD